MGVVLNKSFPAFDMLSHQDTENVVSYGSFVDSYLEQCSCIWVHGCIPVSYTHLPLPTKA